MTTKHYELEHKEGFGWRRSKLYDGKYAYALARKLAKVGNKIWRFPVYRVVRVTTRTTRFPV